MSEPESPEHVDPKAWAGLPEDLRARFLEAVEAGLAVAVEAHGEDEGRRRCHVEAFLVVARRWAWRRRGADARACGDCGEAVLWRWETDASGERAKRPTTRAGQVHACR